MMTGPQEPFSPARWRSGRADLRNLIVITVGWIIMIALVNPIGDFPLNDDWIYAEATRSIVRTGDFRLHSAIMNLISHALWGALFCLPFGCSFTVLRFSTLTLGLGGIFALYALIREIGGDARVALLGAATLAINPLYFDLANSFMTDVPFVSLLLVAIYFIVRGLRRQSNLHLAIGVTASFAAMLDRQSGLAVLLGFAIAYPSRNGWKPTTLLIGIVPAALGVALQVAYQRWLTGTGRGSEVLFTGNLIPSSLPLFIWRSLRHSAAAAPYIGLFALPVVIARAVEAWRGSGGRRDRWARLVCAALGPLLFGALVWRGMLIPSLPNVLIKSGLGPLTLRDTFILSVNDPGSSPGVDGFWLVVSALGVVGCCSILYEMAVIVSATATLRGREYFGRQAWLYCLLVMTALAYWGAMLVAVEQIGVLYDRYLVPLIPLVIVSLIAARQAVDTGGSGVDYRAWAPLPTTLQLALLTCFAAFSIAATHDYLAWNRSRWLALRWLMAEAHVAADRIDGGPEFNGLLLYDPKYQRRKGKSFWWVVDDEYVITSGPLPGYKEYRRYPFDRWLPFPGSSIFVLRRSPADGG